MGLPDWCLADPVPWLGSRRSRRYRFRRICWWWRRWWRLSGGAARCCRWPDLPRSRRIRRYKFRVGHSNELRRDLVGVRRRKWRQWRGWTEWDRRNRRQRRGASARGVVKSRCRNRTARICPGWCQHRWRRRIKLWYRIELSDVRWRRRGGFLARWRWLWGFKRRRWRWCKWPRHTAVVRQCDGMRKLAGESHKIARAGVNMETCFTSCSAFTRAEEGGYVADPRDSGNWTGGQVGDGDLVGSNMGVGAPALAAWMGPGARVTAEQMRKLALPTYEAIARCKYWSPLECGALPPGVDLMMFDFGWNRGVTASLNILIRCLSVSQPKIKLSQGLAALSALESVLPGSILPQICRSGVVILQGRLGIQEDGVAGPTTAKYLEARPDLYRTALILALSSAQISSYRRLANFAIYGTGWLARTARRQAVALSLAQTPVIQTDMSKIAAA